MSGLAVSSLRVGERYRVTNYGDVYEVELVDILSNGNCVFKDLFTLEKVLLEDILQFGKGKDWEIIEHQES
ncbi:MAG: hypothetical protein ACO2ZZ_13510 [Cyclobacteriaceae bacterium]